MPEPGCVIPILLPEIEPGSGGGDPCPGLVQEHGGGNRAVILNGTLPVMNVPGGYLVNGTAADIIVTDVPANLSGNLTLRSPSPAYYRRSTINDNEARFFNVSIAREGAWSIRDADNNVLTSFRVDVYEGGNITPSNDVVFVIDESHTGPFVDSLHQAYCWRPAYPYPGGNMWRDDPCSRTSFHVARTITDSYENPFQAKCENKFPADRILHIGAKRGIVTLRIDGWTKFPANLTHSEVSYRAAAVTFGSFRATDPDSYTVAPLVVPDAGADDWILDQYNHWGHNGQPYANFSAGLKFSFYATAKTTYLLEWNAEVLRSGPSTFAWCKNTFEFQVEV